MVPQLFALAIPHLCLVEEISLLTSSTKSALLAMIIGNYQISFDGFGALPKFSMSSH